MMDCEKQKDIYRLSRVMYILQATLEYFISTLVAGAYLAKVTKAVGMSDGMTGILSALVSLGCGMQIVAVFLTRKRRVKLIDHGKRDQSASFFSRLSHPVPSRKLSRSA